MFSIFASTYTLAGFDHQDSFKVLPMRDPGGPLK